MNPILKTITILSLFLSLQLLAATQESKLNASDASAQAYFGSAVSVSGNTKTNDHVIYREIRTRPGDLFNRSDLIRSQRDGEDCVNCCHCHANQYRHEQRKPQVVGSVAHQKRCDRAHKQDAFNTKIDYA